MSRLRRNRGAQEAQVVPIRIRVNGVVQDSREAVDVTLLDTLRSSGLTGAKEACGRGECGACTVLIDGEARLACIELSALVRGEVTTVEGLGTVGDVVRESFADRSALQCGYCTPGYVVTACAIVGDGDAGTREDDRRRISGNLCRCSGYTQILDALDMARSRLGNR